ncbi:hypothetical protein NitYY0826_C0985 [Nitratiruptor sp. YY08-26]|uniref:thioredoxin family protein n=1 Tax=unclassified Nitratiruptor TaxID=2624044 RepID=UPI00191519E2|nr:MULTISPECIES: DUF255 domain-containing protein [unclassified Nitratiruptor]BCD62115.1 hypothetical protein NitYY0813_C0983 [Nitratiruptor sp. YY08-13]BCD66051.1 hypothetical protein NitYY0826_C0985 [Nitratiruptor sp. YY08-26]
MLKFIILSVPLLLAAQIQWQKDFSTALAIAKKSNKPLMIFYESKNCHWCKKMLHETLHNKKVSSRINNEVIAVKIWKERNDYPASFRAKYTPTTFFITPTQKQIIRPILGYVNVTYFLSYLDDVKRRKKRYKLF